MASGPAGTGSGGQPFDVTRADTDKKQVMVIMMTDIVGYSARMEKDEAAAYALLKEHNVIMRKAITTHRGKEIKTIGDAFMVVFDSPIDALRCGIVMQKGLHELNKPRPGPRPVEDSHRHSSRRGDPHRKGCFRRRRQYRGAHGIGGRTGRHLRFRADIYNEVKGKVEAGFLSIGQPKMKNIANPPRSSASI